MACLWAAARTKDENSIMVATELKRYQIRLGAWIEFLEVWHSIAAARRRKGFCDIVRAGGPGE
jgi:hypothetical protein